MTGGELCSFSNDQVRRLIDAEKVHVTILISFFKKVRDS